MPKWSGGVQHCCWTLVPTVIVHSLPLWLVQGRNQVLLGCEERGPYDLENNTSLTIGIGIDWKYLPGHQKFPCRDCFHELLTENVPKTLSKAPCLVAKRMSLTLHLLLFEQSM